MTDNDGKTCLHHAAQSKALIAQNVVSTIISRGPNLSSFFLIVVLCDMFVSFCFRDIHLTDNDGKTCLHHAAQSKALIAQNVVSTIISRGPNLSSFFLIVVLCDMFVSFCFRDIHLTDNDGKTCLHHAAQSKALIAQNVVSTIISRGPNLSSFFLIVVLCDMFVSFCFRDIHLTDNDGKTCLHHAAQSKALIAQNVVSTIISRGPNLSSFFLIVVLCDMFVSFCFRDIHLTDNDGKTCLHHAAQSKALIAQNVVSTIIAGGPNLGRFSTAVLFKTYTKNLLE